ncbi:MAG: glutamine amidotransferase [Candidatus Hydrogenedentes bacterium]|nr:glutamine amidotransferase [Candidatus Hydrogenedentota bacterium]
MSDWLSSINLFSIRFSYPWALLFLVLIPYTIWLGRHVRSLGKARKWLAIVLRCMVLLCLIAALAGTELVRINDRLAVFFLLDRSNSIPEEQREATQQAVQTLAGAFMTSRDEAGVISFGQEPSIELTVGPSLGLTSVQSYVGGEQTDLAAAIRLAIAAFPQGYMRRIVVFTDGNETRGSALEEVKLAQASGASVDIVPIAIGGRSEVRIAGVTAPNRVNANEPFKVQVNVHADQDGPATLRLYQKVSDGTVMLPPAEVMLQKGANAFLLPQELSASGFYEYEAVIESPNDTVVANNEGRAYTVIHGEPTVLYLASDPEHSQRLAPAMQQEGITVTPVDLGSMPSSLAQLQNYDAVVLDDVSATDLTNEQLRSLEAMVRDFGVGLVMVGGPNSYGAGGYFDTPVERALPVSMDLKQRKQMPQGALVVILHTCEFPDGNAWARDIALAALDVLSSQDLMGALAYDWKVGEDWLFDLQLVGDKSAMRQALNTTNIGDMPSADPTLQMAYDALAASTASVKRVILISDGDPAAPNAALLTQLQAAAISVSTCCINPHSPSDQQMLQYVAAQTGGNYYFVSNPAKLPQIFTKEAALVKRGLLVEDTFVPVVQYDSEILRGMAADALPPLQGYVATTPKESAIISLISDKGDPVLAQWRFGLGKSVAFTSDVTSRWAADWLAWDGFNRFWSQTVRWAMREASPSNFRVDTRVRDGKGYVKIDAVDEQGKYINFLKPQGTVTGPPPEFARQDIALAQTAPGIYEATFPLGNRGVYMINMTYTREDGSQGMIPAGLALDYSKEYEYNTTNMPLIEQLASVGGGRVVKPTDNPFEHNLPMSESVTPIWPYLAALGVGLFPVEIFVRRVMFDLSRLFVGLFAVLRKIPGLHRIIPAPKRRRSQLTGAYGTMTAPSKSFVYVASGSFSVAGQAAAVSAHVPENAPVADGGEVIVNAEEMKAVGRSEYTRQLLEAKERALDKRKRRRKAPGSPDDKEQ